MVAQKLVRKSNFYYLICLNHLISLRAVKNRICYPKRSIFYYCSVLLVFIFCAGHPLFQVYYYIWQEQKTRLYSGVFRGWQRGAPRIFCTRTPSPIFLMGIKTWGSRGKEGKDLGKLAKMLISKSWPLLEHRGGGIRNLPPLNGFLNTPLYRT